MKHDPVVLAKRAALAAAVLFICRLKRTLDHSAPHDLRNSCDRNGLCVFCGSGLLLIRLAGAACFHEFAAPTFDLGANSAVSDDYGAYDTNQIIVVNPRTPEIVDVVDA